MEGWKEAETNSREIFPNRTVYLLQLLIHTIALKNKSVIRYELSRVIYGQKKKCYIFSFFFTILLHFIPVATCFIENQLVLRLFTVPKKIRLDFASLIPTFNAHIISYNSRFFTVRHQQLLVAYCFLISFLMYCHYNR